MVQPIVDLLHETRSFTETEMAAIVGAG